MKKDDRQLINPFTDTFIPTWDLWKDFRKEEHNFAYKGVISEQMALKRLVEVSEGDEEKAIRIVEQSISRGWMDFYKLKQPSNDGNTARKSKQSTPKEPEQSLREQAADEFMRRNGGGEQSGDGTHLKAV
jgi:hypothetical protein